MPKQKKERFVILDGNALIHRSFHALPPLTTKKGEVVNAVFGFTSVLLKVLKDLKPDYLAATFDLRAPTFRHEEYAEYKATRVKAPQELYDQIPRVKDVVSTFSIPIYEQAGFEADDIIGTIAKKLDGKGIETIIVTGDMDTLQLVDDDTKVFTLRKGLTDTVLYDEAAVRERLDGLTPEQIVDLKALAGDASDNIPGVRGIGQKTAIELLTTFGSLEALYKAIEEESSKLRNMKPRTLALLQEHKKDAKLSKKLATIVRNVPIPFVLKDAKAKSYDRAKVVALFQELEFKSLLNRLPQASLFGVPEESAGTQQALTKKPKRTNVTYTLVETRPQLDALLKKFKNVTTLAVDTETTSINELDAKLLGVSMSWKEGEAYYIHLNHKDGTDWLRAMKTVLEEHTIDKIGHNVKYDFKILKRADVDLAPVHFDSMIASYLLNPGSRQHSLDALAFSEFGYEMTPITALIGPKGKNQRAMDQVPVADLADYSCEDADYTFRLARKLKGELTKQGADHVFSTIEMPLIPVLADMELAGIKVDTAVLSDMAKRFRAKLKKIEQQIFKDAGGSFNINSPAQLKEVLFTKLKISTEGIGKTKTGLSTAAAELEKLKTAHPIISRIMEYRELAKLLSTYLETLPELVHPSTGRIHTDFNQAVAATGRLSSNNPNLQNIPIRTEVGREIRTAFIAERGMRLISADYSQIELRLVATLANDEKMIASFRKGEDIHRRTAAEINHVPLDQVTKEQRYAAKEVNFGVIYGMGVYGLASRTGIPREEAKRFIDEYFRLYKGVKAYLEQTKALARSQGYVETLFGRRRPIPEINSTVQVLRNAGERMAVNMPIQGTAADLMKKAMIEVHKGLQNVSPQARLILQVHDELVVEAPEKDAKRVATFLKETMEQVEKLKVPIEAEVAIGMNWGDMEEVA